MIPRPFAEVASVGVAVPPGVLTNADLTRMLDTSDAWIVERTGIRERHIARPEETVAMLSQEASERAMARAGVDGGPARRDRPRHREPRPAAALHRVRSPGPARRRERRGVRHRRGVPGLRVRADRGRGPHCLGAERDGARGRRGEAVRHHGLPGPLHRYPVRRRRRGRDRAALLAARPRSSSRPSSSRTGAWPPCCTGPAAAPPIRSASASCASGPTT